MATTVIIVMVIEIMMMMMVKMVIMMMTDKRAGRQADRETGRQFFDWQTDILTGRQTF